MLDATSDTVDNMDKSLLQLQKVFRTAGDRIDSIIAEVEAAKEDERVELLIDLLGGDSDLYGKFFSSLVDVQTEEIYSVASYGAAMAPFYSVLAVWVGGVILVSILKTEADRKKFPGLSEAKYFFGKFLLFFVIGQLQAAVIVAGDIFLLDCQPVHPWLMWLSAAVTSLVFVLFIFALTLSFGDVGKAIVVVVMVVQIAGSSGSYPIEILPVIFSKIYRFFPFPYAINAMREALCGTYGYDYVRFLAELLVFGALGIVIGLIVRRPFIGLNKFVSEKIEETEVL
jgi:putative membrane protein